MEKEIEGYLLKKKEWIDEWKLKNEGFGWRFFGLLLAGAGLLFGVYVSKLSRLSGVLTFGESLIVSLLFLVLFCVFVFNLSFNDNSESIMYDRIKNIEKILEKK